MPKRYILGWQILPPIPSLIIQSTVASPVTLFNSALFIFYYICLPNINHMKMILVYLYFLLISFNKIKCECEDRVCWSCFYCPLPMLIRWTKHIVDVHTFYEMNEMCFKNTSLFSNLICFSSKVLYSSSSKSPRCQRNCLSCSTQSMRSLMCYYKFSTSIKALGYILYLN